MKKNIIQQIEELLQGDDMAVISAELKELRAQFNEAVNAAEEERMKTFLEEGGQKDDFQRIHDDEDKHFMELMTSYNERKKKFDLELIVTEQKNLEEKRLIIEDLKQLIAEESNISKAFKGLHDIKKRWEAAGNVPKEVYKEIQHEFSLQQEYFYYNINIYRTLQTYDLEKNFKRKEELIAKMEALLNNQSIKEVREQVELLIREWDTTGPTFKEKWQEVRDRFWAAAAKVHKKIKDHFTDVKEKQKVNLEAKQQLCEKVEKINESEYSTEKIWRKKTTEVKGIQEEWKGIGFATKKQNDKIWTRFRAALDVFFDRKKAFYGELKEEHSEHETKKLALIDEAEKLKSDTDWKKTTEAMVRLQKRWKNIGHTGIQKESRLWRKFNNACNAFFEAKKKYYDTLDDRLEEQLKQKEAIVKKITDYELSGDKKKDLAELKSFAMEWSGIEAVPKNKREEVYNAYNNAMDQHYTKMKLDPSERESAKFDSRIEGLKKAKNSDELLQKERGRIKDKIRKLEAEVVQYENNLGFFGSSSGDNPIVKQAEQNVTVAKEELQRLKDRLKQVN